MEQLLFDFDSPVVEVKKAVKVLSTEEKMRRKIEHIRWSQRNEPENWYKYRCEECVKVKYQRREVPSLDGLMTYKCRTCILLDESGDHEMLKKLWDLHFNEMKAEWKKLLNKLKQKKVLVRIPT